MDSDKAEESTSTKIKTNTMESGLEGEGMEWAGSSHLTLRLFTKVSGNMEAKMEKEL